MRFLEQNLVDIDRVKPYPNNAKKHPQSQIDLLAKQIADGFDQPIVVDKNFVIIKGHGRLLASQQLGLKQVPVIVRDDLTEQQVKAVRIADNKLAETDWDLELLMAELQSLDSEGFDINDLGFDDSVLDGVLSELEETENDGNTTELDPEGFDFDHKCPKCGFEWDD